MRNLLNTKHAKFKLSDNAETAITATTWDVSDDSLVLAFGPSKESPSITLKRLPADAKVIEDALEIASWDAPSPNPDLEFDRIVDLHCFPDRKAITLILEGGDIVVVREEAQPGEDLIEIVGSIDAGIRAASWSPDEELLAVCSGAGTMLFMTRDFDSIANITLAAEDLKVSNHVSVGWGKKETQFKGRGAAKALRDPTMPEHVDEGTLSFADDGRVTISWRGDGQFVAVNSALEGEQKRRVIRVYSREGLLESVSEPINCLEGALSWKPKGQLIAGVQRHDDEIDIVFFERNGLRHGEFSLRLTADEMAAIRNSIDLKWNTDSTVLAVSLKDRVQLWTMGNYHYYLKQEIILSRPTNHLTSTVWHPEKPLQLSCSTVNDLRRLSYRLEVCRGSVIPPHDVGLVAVIDGKKLKVTPLRTANVPPPMALDEVDLPDNALDVAINGDGTELAVLHHSSVSVLSCDYAAKPPKMAKLHSSQILPKHTSDDIRKMQLSGDRALQIRADRDSICYEEVEGSSSTPINSSDPPAAQDQHREGVASYHLTDGGMLQVYTENQRLRIPKCTSYVVTASHLIYTTSSHLLKFIHLLGPDLMIPPDEPETDERCRSIERGAKIVTVMPSAYSLVLHMPRGNLETIFPRALVLAGIRESIRDRDYKKAFLTCRTHRVDMNILHDYAPQQFMHDVELFVKQIQKVEFVDLFLSSLSEENVSVTMYKDTLAPTEDAVINGPPCDAADGRTNGTNGANGHLTNGSAILTPPTGSSKVNKICDAFLHVLQRHTASRLQNIVTAHVCKNPPDLEAGVRLVSELRKEGDQERLEQAVEHICFLADVNQLYDTALGVYDLDVALLIAQQSQKDPREYLPYLQELLEMTMLRRQFKIDDDLKRYPKALTHLHALQASDELQIYVVKHELYAAAIDIYRYDTIPLGQLMRLYADHLNSRNKYKEAGIAYEYIGDHAAAYEAFKAVGTWRECLSNAAMVPLSSTDLANVAQDLASSLEEGKEFVSAATIHLDYLNDLESSAKMLCKGYQFAEATRQVTLRQRHELLKTIIDVGLVEASASMTELLAEMKSQIAAQVPRLQELRQKKADDPMAFLDGANGGDGDVPDNVSLAPTDTSTSGGTFMTRYTNRSTGTLATNATRKTSKNRRREERKRARGKKGTVYEEEYLVNSISRLVQRLNDVGEDVTRLIEGLMRRGMRERAIAVQTVLDEVTTSARECMDEVFSTAKEPLGQDGEVIGDGDDILPRPWGGQGVLWDALTSQKQEAPVLKALERLSLLP
ncbi:putative elongator complex protein 1 [Extremus antarcticus]|uniref:Elongator complex protein 1 n=1 Tax=Extremus antarcticus TaxID=702011 RepID=A0AAJ0DI71_9PEZI|nr:putative elongator complex protein 1 [Extremus antarcticus]